MPPTPVQLQALLLLTVGLWCAALCPAARAQAIDPTNRPVKAVRVEGLEQVPEQLVLNQVRIAPGDPYDPKVVEEDIVRITYLNRFDSVVARVDPQPDGSVVLVYVVSELPLVSDVQVVGNKAISDQELLRLVGMQSGDPADPFLIDRGIKRIEQAYENRGYFVADVTMDEGLLRESSILIFRVREGPRVRIKTLTFEGNKAFSNKQLKSRIRSRSHILIFRKGELSREQLNLDKVRLEEFYRSQGYLDARVGRRIELSPNEKEAIVFFQIEEGARFLVDSIGVEGNVLFPAEQVRQIMALKVGDFFSADRLRRSRRALLTAYGKLGYLPDDEAHNGSTRVEIVRFFHEDAPRVDVVVKITEGKRYLVGSVSIIGNQLTRQKVIQRELRGLNPGRPYDYAGLEQTRRRLNESRLFREGRITILGDPDDAVRDAAVEVVEQNTGEISFGAGISSDSGVIGALSLVQRNFDITDFPESPGEFFTGKAFRGAGQFFSISLSPGNEFSSYSVSFREPYLFDSPYFLDTSGFFFQREREDFDEERLGARFGLGQRFGDVWSASIRARAETVDIRDIEAGATVDVFAVAGDSVITSLGIGIVRDTTDSFIFPTRGDRLELSLSRAGALGGDFDFTRAEVEWKTFWTVDEDFFERKTILSLRVSTGLIFEENEAPLFERFYAGGSRTFRGFDFRGVGPRGIQASTGTLGDDPVGGDWLFLLGLEYSFPIFSAPAGLDGRHSDIIRGVLFTDTGTVQDDIGFDEYRVSVGVGVRVSVPFLGQVPIALDMAVPLIKEDDDEVRVISFDIALPLR
ncbi:MAG: outer membrane protein assembly factor BamA [Phycisphaeraceae bacterium]